MRTIVEKPADSHSPSAAGWSRLLADAVRDPDELCDLLELPDEFRGRARQAAKTFPLIVPRNFVARMGKGDPNDPLLRQVLPCAEEFREVAGFCSDPVGDLASQTIPGLLHKYRGRVLLIMTGACAVNCRYCFRRHFPYHETPRGIERWQPALDQIRADKTISEVILSGGDPLMLTDEWLAMFSRRIALIEHVHRLRIHTRMPIVLPERVTDELVDWLTGTRLQPVMVVHANHAAEIGGECEVRLRRLSRSGVLMLNQSVLLRGINDDAGILADLSTALIRCGVLPYYLHQLDAVAGAAHFAVPVERGLAIINDLRRRLPGYAVPRFVRETPGEGAKTVLR